MFCVAAQAQDGAPRAPADVEPSKRPVESGMLEGDLVPLSLVLNGQFVADMVMFVRDSHGRFWIEESEALRLRLRLPADLGRYWLGTRYLPLSALPGARVELDALRSELKVMVEPDGFDAQLLRSRSRHLDAPVSVHPGAFLNYQIAAHRDRHGMSGSAWFEAGLFSSVGSLVSTHTLRRVAGQADSRITARRLSTTFVHDDPERMISLSLGDAISDSANWGSSLRYGGIRFARNFALQPDLVTMPGLEVNGSAIVPSSVEVFFNQQTAFDGHVNPGPFSVGSLHGPVGAGTITLQIRDDAGIVRQIQQPFYASTELLAPGLWQYALDGGFLREGYGLSDADYGPMIGSVSLRRGLSSFLTAGAHAEYSKEARAAGISIAALAWHVGVITGTLAAGGTSAEGGALAGLAFERRGERFSAMLSGERASAGFRRVVDTLTERAPLRSRERAQVGYHVPRAGRLMLTWARQRYQDGSGEQALSLTHSIEIGRHSALQLHLLHTDPQASRPVTSALLTFTSALGHARTLQISAEHSRSSARKFQTAQLAVMQAAPPGEGDGFYLRASDQADYHGRWQRNWTALETELQASRLNGLSTQSLTVRGATAYVAGLRVMRSVRESFAVVDVGDLAGVPVYVENHVVARTNSRGEALIPGLRAHEVSRVSLEPADLPLDVSLRTPVLKLRPAGRAGALARFELVRVRPAIAQLRLDDGSPVPAGAEAVFNGASARVALDGNVYLTTFETGTGTANWSEGRCNFDVSDEAVDPADPLPDLGVLTCRREAS